MCVNATLRLAEDGVTADPPPDHMSARSLGRAVLEGGATVGSPGHLENVVGALDAVDSKAGPEGAGRQICVEPPERCPERLPIGLSQRLPVPLEATSTLV